MVLFHRKRWLLLGLVGLLFSIAIVGLWFYQKLEASLPQLEGEAVLEGLVATVSVERDTLGIPTIRGGNRMDVARACGFVHAQERYFQMDMLRRLAAGELAELVGEAALEKDKEIRLHRFRALASKVLAVLSEHDRMLVDAYVAGVNAGLAALEAPPFEYLLLRTAPAPWRAEDTLLVVYAMYLDLQARQKQIESIHGLMHDTLPQELYNFLAPRGTEWDAPLLGGSMTSPPVPGPEILDLRQQPIGELTTGVWIKNEPPLMAGSNNFAVAGKYSKHGGALLADDMHLRIRVPNIWYRAAFVYPDNQGQERRVSGITLPGAPAMVVGSNGRVAWGFTNSGGDWSDLVILEPGEDGETYLTPDGPRRLQHHQEIIRVKGEEEQILDVRWTHWGPLVDSDHQGRRRVLRWVAHDLQAADMGLLAMEAATTVEQALEVANRTGMPAQNILVADADGHIAWTIAGPIPRRFGHQGRIPQSWADGSRGWDGCLSPAEYPRIVDPPGGRLWTANARVVDGDMLARLGDGNYALGARAKQIRDDLLALEQADEKDLLALQLDDRALFWRRWRELLLQVLTPEALSADPRRQELREAVENWGGRAAVDSVGFRMVRAFRVFLAEQVFQALTAPYKALDEGFQYPRITQYEGPLWRLVIERPPHLLDSRYPDWSAQFLAAVDAMLDYFLANGSALAEHTWGAHNTSRIRHPLSRFIPGAGRWLDMPATPLPGDGNMPRVQTPTSGASQRLVVSPGLEAQGILHMPGGQSGHPLSSHYRDGHEAWIHGQAMPFLPGPTLHRLLLSPVGVATGE